MKGITNNLIWFHNEHEQTGTMCHIAYIVLYNKIKSRAMHVHYQSEKNIFILEL